MTKKVTLRYALVIIIILSIIIGLNYLISFFLAEYKIEEYNQVDIKALYYINGVFYSDIIIRFTDEYGDKWRGLVDMMKITKITYDPSLNDSKLIVTTSRWGEFMNFVDPCCKNNYLFVNKTDWERMKELNLTNWNHT